MLPGGISESIGLLFCVFIHQVSTECDLGNETPKFESRSNKYVVYTIQCNNTEAQEACRAIGYQPPVIYNPADNKDFSTAADINSIKSSTNGFWLGATSNLTEWHFSGISHINPDTELIKNMNDSLDRFCGSLHFQQGKFTLQAMACASKKSFLCRRKPQCEIQHNNNCIYIHHEKMAWYDARTYCENRSGLLAHLSSQEIKSLTRVLQNWSKDLWIGLKKERWQWTEGKEEINFTNWEENQPSSKSEMCIEVKPQGKWNDITCSDKNFVVCMKNGTFINDQTSRNEVLTDWLIWAIVGSLVFLLICISIALPLHLHRKKPRKNMTTVDPVVTVDDPTVTSNHSEVISSHLDVPLSDSEPTDPEIYYRRINLAELPNDNGYDGYDEAYTPRLSDQHLYDEIFYSAIQKS